jgi:hypothetical protein
LRISLHTSLAFWKQPCARSLEKSRKLASSRYAASRVDERERNPPNPAPMPLDCAALVHPATLDRRIRRNSDQRPWRGRDRLLRNKCHDRDSHSLYSDRPRCGSSPGLDRAASTNGDGGCAALIHPTVILGNRLRCWRLRNRPLATRFAWTTSVVNSIATRPWRSSTPAGYVVEDRSAGSMPSRTRRKPRAVRPRRSGYRQTPAPWTRLSWQPR